STVSCVVSAFRTYQPLLSAIKKEYENTLACQQNVIRELEPLRSHLRLMAKESAEGHQGLEGQRGGYADHGGPSPIRAVRKERDARRLLIWQLNELKGGSVKTEIPAEGNREDNKDSVELKLALKVCQEDLTKTQEELTRVKAEYWDSLEQAHNLTQLQVL
ncbi:hypothetical protein GOODEAATRI_014633, partial [Goodea atripinnis]